MSDKPKFAPLFQPPREAPSPMNPAVPGAFLGPPPKRPDASAQPNRVVITGLEVPFFDLVLLYIQLLFAAIPAAAIAFLIIWVVRAALNS